MKTNVFIAIILAGMSLCAIVGATATGSIDLEVARDNVQQFIENSDTAVEFQEILSINSGDYMIFKGDSNEYYVNAETGFVERIDFSEEKIINLETYSKKKMFSKERSFKMASTYANRFYRDFDTKKMQLVSADLIDHHFAKEYRFVWEQLIDGVETPNCVMISINPANGKILTYIGLSRDIEVSLTPSVTQESALDIAVSQFPSIVPADSEATLRIDYPEKDDQRLIWMVEIMGEPVENVMQGGLVAVDAQTGEVLVVCPYA